MGLLKDIKALVEGLGITSKHLARHAVTIQYPEEKWTMPERSRGMVVLLSDKETGELNCTACMLCMRACPTAAIRIDAPRDEKKKRHLKSFVVDHRICCFCGLCEEACNFTAIKLTGKYEYSVSDKDDLVFDMNKLQEEGRDVPYTPKPKKKPVAKTTTKKPNQESASSESKAEPEKVPSKKEDKPDIVTKPEESPTDGTSPKGETSVIDTTSSDDDTKPSQSEEGKDT